LTNDLAATPASTSNNVIESNHHNTRSKAKSRQELKTTDAYEWSPFDVHLLDFEVCSDEDSDNDENVDRNSNLNACYFIPYNDNPNLNHETLQKLPRYQIGNGDAGMGILRRTP
jgi:hypothetical protein